MDPSAKTPSCNCVSQHWIYPAKVSKNVKHGEPTGGKGERTGLTPFSGLTGEIELKNRIRLEVLFRMGIF